MKELFELTEEFANKIVEIENIRKKVGNFLREISKLNLNIDEEILEEKIIQMMSKGKLDDLCVAGIDGGLVRHSFHGIDIMLLRAVGVIFYFKNGKIEKVDYWPDSFPSFIPKIVFDPFTDIELELNSNFERQIVEVKNATEVIKNFKPDILLLDGSVVPHYIERPINSLLFQTYQNLIEAYLELFKEAQKNKTILAGIVEDSRGTRFCEIVTQKILSKEKEIAPDVKLLLNKTIDSNLLTYTLNLGERTFVFKYSSSPERHPILKEFGKIAHSIFSFYLKTAEFDRPIRIDFLGESEFIERANFISSVILALCGHSNYGIPSVLIEADQRARLSEKDLEIFYNDLLAKTGNLAALFLQRREQRPF